MKIALAVPPSADLRSGNWRSAARWARMLRSLGHRVRSVTEWSEGDEDVLIALHARKSHASIASFHARRPQCPIVVVLTGTDVYCDIRSDAEAQDSLQIADRLVVLQERALDEITRALKRKASIVHQSCATRLEHAPPASKFRLCVIAHLREEKDPFCAARALGHLNGGRVELLQIGEALEAGMKAEALAWAAREPRYRWLGSVAHARALRWMAASHLLVVSSLMEGGANVVSEAITIGVPVLASRIAGNTGMLGLRYPGYFETGDAKALARLIERAVSEPRYYDTLRRGVVAKRPLFTPEAELAAWKRVLSSL